MAKYLLLCLLGLSLCNCARTILADPAKSSLQAYIGHPVSEVISRFGPPKASFSMGGGKMAFQWDQSVLGQSLAATPDAECRLDTIIAIARSAHSPSRAIRVAGLDCGGMAIWRGGLRVIGETERFA